MNVRLRAARERGITTHAPPSRSPRRLRSASPGQAQPAASSRNAGTGSCSRPGDDENGAVVRRPRARRRASWRPDRERERLVRLLAAERHELLGSGRAGDHLAPGDRAHRRRPRRPGCRRSTGSRSRAGSCRSAARAPSGWARRRGEVAVNAATSPPLCELPHPVAEHAGRETPAARRRRGAAPAALRPASSQIACSDEVAERAVAVPALEPLGCLELLAATPPGSSDWGLQPRDARVPVTELAPRARRRRSERRASATDGSSKPSARRRSSASASITER